MPRTIERPAGVALTVSSPAEPDPTPRLARLPYLPWLAAALLGSGATLLLGWVAVGATLAAGWVTLPTLPPAVVLDTVAQAWIGIHGVPFRAGGLTVGLTPLGLSFLLGVAMAAVARYSARQRADDGRSSLTAALLIAVACTLSYSLGALLLATLVGAPRQAAGVFAGALVVSGAGSAVGALRACGVRVLSVLPGSLRGVPWGVTVGLAGLTLASAVTFGLGLGAHADQVRTLHAALGPDAVGSVLLVLLYLSYLPTILLWSGSYALGSGFAVGTETLVTPWVSQLGLLPGLPLAGALPSVPPAHGWVFLASGPVAGLLAGSFASRLAHPDARALTRVLAAAVTGGLVGVVWVAASWLARGDLGQGHLVGLGPRFPELILYTLVPLVGGALLAGAADAVWRRLRPVPGDSDDVDAASGESVEPNGTPESGDEATIELRR